MNIHKTTIGFVTQIFNEDGKFVSQSFIAGDQVEYENENGEAINPDVECYFPMDMEQELK
jgi:hypothetical protein